MFYELVHNFRYPRRFEDLTIPLKEIEVATAETTILWRTGEKITDPVPDPVVITLLPIDKEDSLQGPMIPDYFNATVPLFSIRFLKLLKGTGIDYLDTYNAVIVDGENRQKITTHKAVNVLKCFPFDALQGKELKEVKSDPKMSNALLGEDAHKPALFYVMYTFSLGCLCVNDKLKDFLTDKKVYTLDYV